MRILLPLAKSKLGVTEGGNSDKVQLQDVRGERGEPPTPRVAALHRW
jgi:hypothetical protein